MRNCNRPKSARCDECHMLHPLSAFYGRLPHRIGGYLHKRFGFGMARLARKDRATGEWK